MWKTSPAALPRRRAGRGFTRWRTSSKWRPSRPALRPAPASCGAPEAAVAWEPTGMSGDLYVSFGADTGELEAAFAKASAEVRGLARELSSMANEARKTGADADCELGQKLNATAESLALAKGHVRELKDEMKGFGDEARQAGEGGGALSRIGEAFEGALSPLASLRAGFAEMAELVAAAFAVEKVKEFVESMASLGLETKKASEVLGVSTEDVGALRSSPRRAGSSLEQLEMHSPAWRRTSRRRRRARSGRSTRSACRSTTCGTSRRSNSLR